MAEEKVDNNQAGELMHQGLRNVQVDLSSVFEKVQAFKLGHKSNQQRGPQEQNAYPSN